MDFYALSVDFLIVQAALCQFLAVKRQIFFLKGETAVRAERGALADFAAAFGATV